MTHLGMPNALQKMLGMESIARLGPSEEKIVDLVGLPLDDKLTM